MDMATFVAIDFETADQGRDSACSIGIVKVANDRIVLRKQFLIRPPRRQFIFTYIHGIEWKQVAKEPTFKEVWPMVESIVLESEFLAAHNATFDSGVLNACCRAAGLNPPSQRFVCTVALARKVWSIYPTKLPLVCVRLGIDLDHHNALSDAEACANIVIQAKKAGAQL
jgi:DNA polymerase-3 subunit epsilon